MMALWKGWREYKHILSNLPNSLNVMISGIVLLSALSEVRTHIDYAMKLKSIHCRVDTRTKVNLVVSAAVGIIFIRG